MNDPTYSRGLHWWAILTALVTLPLMLLGADVTSKQVGMADPEGFRVPWHIFIVPLRELGVGFMIEHTHRLLGFIVGTCSIVLAVWAWRAESRRWVRWLALSALIGVCLQGLLGGFRVRLNATLGPQLTFIHGLFAQVVFSLIVSVALVTSKAWHRMGEISPRLSAEARRCSKWMILAVAGQILLGAVVRHTFQWWGPRLHILMAVVVAAVAMWLARALSGARPMSGAAKFLLGLIFVQVALGVEAWLTKFSTGSTMWPQLRPLLKPAAYEADLGGLIRALMTHPDLFRSLHYITASLILATSVSLALYVRRLPITKHDPLPSTEKGEAA